MHIYSKLEETGEILSDVILSDAYREDAEIKNEVATFNKHPEVEIFSETISTDGLHIVETKINTKIDLSNKWFTSGPHIRYFFYLQGNSMVRGGAGHEDYAHNVGMLQRNFLDSKGNGGTALISKNDKTHHVIIKMSLDYYTALVRGENWIKKDKFHHYIMSAKPENRANETFFIDLTMYHILQDILKSKYIDTNGQYYLQIKLRELLFALHQLIHFGASTKEHRDRSAYSPDVLEKVRAYLIMHLDRAPTLTELTKTFMLNEKKLKRDFKTTYGYTIYAFIVVERMKKAEKLLIENYNVTEVASMLGYQSISHFIKIFKKHYGFTPKDLSMKLKSIVSRAGNTIQLIALSTLFYSI